MAQKMNFQPNFAGAEFHNNLWTVENQSEQLARFRFIKKFEAKYRNSQLKFNSCSLDEALTRFCFQKGTSKKMLLLYIHNENDKFAQLFFSLLANKQIEDLLSSKFFLLAWDVRDESNNSALLDITKKYSDFDALNQYISNKSSVLFFIALLEEVPTIFFHLDDDGIDEHILIDVLESASNLKTELKSEWQFSDECNAITSFTNKFHEKYGGNLKGVPSSLENAINNSCLVDIRSRKMLALYFHNENTEFSKQFCSAIVKERMEKLLSEFFLFLPWDVAVESYHSDLKKALQIRFELTPLIRFIEKKQSALFIIMPIQNSIKIEAAISEKGTEKNLFEHLTKASDTFKSEMKSEEDLADLEGNHDESVAIDSTRFQQMMYEHLGNRDYDAFEDNQHDLLKDKLGFAYFGPPQSIKGYEDKQKKKIEEAYEKICEVNDRYSEYPGKIVVSFLFNVLEPLPAEKLKRSKKEKDYNPRTDINPIPIFVLRKCKSTERFTACRMIIDHDLRVYDSWANYIEDNKLHECIMVLPKNGRYLANDETEVLLETHLSPPCSISRKVLLGLDITSTGVGLASAGVFVAALIPAISVAPILLVSAGVAGIGVGLYSVGRSIHNLVDRKIHEQDMSVLNSESRGAYINIVAGSLGFAGAGATTAVSQLVSRGVVISQSARTCVTVINVANIGAGGFGVLNSSFEVLYQYFKKNEKPSLLTLVQLGSSVLFFANSVYNFKTTSTVIEEYQKSIINDYRDSLRSNRHRENRPSSKVLLILRNYNRSQNFEIMYRVVKKEGNVKLCQEQSTIYLREVVSNVGESSDMKFERSISEKTFRKFELETVRQNSGDSMAGRAEVIAAIKQIPDKNEVFAILTRSNKMFNEKNVKFAAKDGKIILNGKFVDIGNLGSMSKTDVAQFLTELPPTPTPTAAQTATMSKLFSEIFSFDYLYIGQNLLASNGNVSQILMLFSPIIQKKLLIIVNAVLQKMDLNDVLTELFKKAFPVCNKIAKVLDFVLHYIKQRVEQYEEKYLQEYEQKCRLPGFNEREFKSRFSVSPDKAKRLLEFVERAVNICVNGVDMTNILESMMKSFTDWIVQHVASVLLNEETHKTPRRSSKPIYSFVRCKVCSGKYLKL